MRVIIFKIIVFTEFGFGYRGQLASGPTEVTGTLLRSETGRKLRTEVPNREAPKSFGPKLEVYLIFFLLQALNRS